MENKEKLIKQLFVGKVSEILGTTKTAELLKEATDAIDATSEQPTKTNASDANLNIANVSVCCDWERKMKNLLKGLETQHIDKLMDEANVNEYLEYGIAYMNEVRHIINKR